MTDDAAKQNDDPVLMWRERMLDLVREYRISDDGEEVRAAWKDIREHLESIPVAKPCKHYAKNVRRV